MHTALIKHTLQPDPLDKMIRGCREQDLQQQEQLYRYCYPEMIKICLRYAGDSDGAGIIFNNAMLRVFKSIGHYQDQGKLIAWVKKIVVNCCLDFIRQRHRFINQPIGPIHENEVIVPAEVLHELSAKDIRTMIGQLPKTTSVVFNLFIYEGFTHKEIAECLDISEGTSKWHVNEGRRLLKTKFETTLNSNNKNEKR